MGELRYCSSAARPQAITALPSQQLHAAGVSLTTVESVMFSLMQDSKHPAFKALLQTIKAHASRRNELGPPGCVVPPSAER